MSLAIFDLDNTLLNGDSDHAWGEFLIKNKRVSAEWYGEKNDYFYQQYLSGELDMLAYQAFVLSVLKEQPISELHQWREQFLIDTVEPMVLPKALELIDFHKDRGDQLLIITATNDFITGPIADRLGISELIATTAEIQNNRYTGNVRGIPSFQSGKIKRLNIWLKDKNLKMTDSWFYSDSHNDLPLLELVDHPIAVDPDEKLREFATNNNWNIISLR